MLLALSEANEAALIGSIAPSMVALFGAITGLFAWLKSRQNNSALSAAKKELADELFKNTRATLVTKEAAVETAAAVNGQRKAMVDKIDQLEKTILDNTRTIAELKAGKHE